MTLDMKERLNQIKIRAMDQEGYFTLRRVLVKSKCMTRNEALFYTDLCNLACMASDEWALEIDGKQHFLCTVNYMEEYGLDWDRNIQQRMFGLLEAKGYVHVTHKGTPPTRYVWINAEAVEDFIQQWQLSRSIKQCSLKSIKQCHNEEPPYGGSKQQKNLSRPASRACDGGSDGLDLPEPQPSEDAVQSKARAIRLRDALSNPKHNKLTRRAHIPSWTKQFESLLQYRPHEVIDRVLDWYCDHVGQPMIVAAYSAESFVREFARIEDAMSRSSNGHAKDNKPITVSDDARRIVEELRDLDWRGTDDQLPSLIQASLDNYREFRRRFGLVRRTLNGTVQADRHVELIMDRFRDRFDPDPVVFVREWFVALHGWLINKPKWSGSLSPALAFSVANKEFQREGRALTDSPELWDALLARMKEVGR